MNVPRWPVHGLVFGVLWVFVQGPELAGQPLLATFLVGTAVGLPVAYVFRRLWYEEFSLSQVMVVGYVFLYAITFIREVIVANLDVTYRVLAPGMPIEPQVIMVPLRVESAIAITTIATSISITPGTVTMDYDPDENGLYVHAINGREPEAIVEPIRRWEDYALRIFTEKRSADDLAPDVRVHPPDSPPEPKRAPPAYPEEIREVSEDDS